MWPRCAVLALGALFVITTSAAPVVPAATTLAEGSTFPFPYDWNKFPSAWFGANDTDWESEAQLAAIGKYSMAILGWQHLDPVANWTAVVYYQLAQAAIIKERHPDMPVFVYCGFGWAMGLNNASFPPIMSVMKDPVNSPYRDFFLQSTHGPVFTNTDCRQGHTTAAATGNRCTGYFWNMGNSSARDYFVTKLVTPLAISPAIDGVFFDAVNYGYDIPEVRPFGLPTLNVPDCTNKGGPGCEALVAGTIDVAVRTTKLLNAHGKVPMLANPGSFHQPENQHIWLDEARLVKALAGTSWMTYYESMRAESILNGCPTGGVTKGMCVLDNMLKESKIGLPAVTHTYLKHINASDPTSPVESQLTHIAAFMLAQAENWYYLGSTQPGWWDYNYVWDKLYDEATTCGKPKEPAPAAGSGPVYTRAFEHCKVSLDCTDSTFCKGDIQFGL